MMKSKRNLTIVLAPEHLTVANISAGKVIQAERMQLDPMQWKEAWSGGLHMFDQPLRQLLARVGGRGKSWNADLFYISPSSICRLEISDLDEAASHVKMCNGLKESIGRSNPVNSACLHASNGHSLSLGIADTDENLQKLYAWLNRSNIVANRIVPREAGVVRQAILDAATVDEGTAILYLAGRSSLIGYCERGVPRLARMTEIGYNKLTDIYYRALLEYQESSSKPIPDSIIGAFEHQHNECLHHDDARNRLFEDGIPLGHSDIKSDLGNLMPSMAPILQRISIEIKQTFRFASSLERSPSRLLICGPGAAIPKIGAALSESLDMHVDIDPRAKEYRPAELFGRGTCERAAACGFGLDIELLPKAAKEIRTLAGITSAVKVGAVAAALFIVGQYFYASYQTRLTEQEIAKLSNEIELIELDRSRRSSVKSMADSLGSAATLINTAIGDNVDWTTVLGKLPDDQREFVQVTELQGKMNGSRPILTISGTTVGNSNGFDASQVLSVYVKSLGEIKQIHRIEIGSTTRVQINEEMSGLRFTLAVEVVAKDSLYTELMRLSDAR